MMNISPKAQYEQDIASGKIRPDPSQKKAIQLLDEIYRKLKEAAKTESHFLPKWFRGKEKKNPKGAYLWGGVGRGKSYLMDLFFHSLDFLTETQKKRIHFNRFMEEVHANLRRCQGEKDPLKHVAKKMTAELKVLCFDEFFVEDIADAMILGKLFNYLFQEGLCWIATSNSPPEGLYQDGLKREQFLPAIDRIQANTEVLCVDSGIDYREGQVFDHMQRYFYPLSGQETFLTRYFEHLKSQFHESDLPLTLKICEREIHAIRHSLSVVWIDFAELCKSPRGKADYIELADRYRAILVSSVPVFKADTDDQARRFIAFVDEIYDNAVEWVIAAAALPEDLYQGERHQFAFKRTLSRLQTLIP